MQVLFVSIFIFSRTVSSFNGNGIGVDAAAAAAAASSAASVVAPAPQHYIYSFYINLSFNDVNDFIFRFFTV